VYWWSLRETVDDLNPSKVLFKFKLSHQMDHRKLEQPPCFSLFHEFRSLCIISATVLIVTVPAISLIGLYCLLMRFLLLGVPQILPY